MFSKRSTIVSTLALFALLLLPAPAFAQEQICACFFLDDKSIEYCEENTTAGGLQSLADTEDCRIFCESQASAGNLTFQNKVNFSDDITSLEGAQIQNICASVNQERAGFLEVQEQAAQGGTIAFTSPRLSVPIPGLEFTEPLQRRDVLTVNFIGEYLDGVYRFLLGISTTIAIVLVMIAGAQYVLSAGSDRLTEAKRRLTNAVVGFVLLLSVYVILFTVNPRLTIFEGVNLLVIDQILHEDTSGEEGVDLGARKPQCAEAIQDAVENGECKIEEGFISPTGGPESCNYHFRTKDYDYKKINALDWPRAWNGPLLAPFGGTVTAKQRTSTDNRCGNTISIRSPEGAVASICHVKDFVDENGRALRTGDSVTQGQQIGHIGGRCCDGEVAPSGWSQGDKCTFTGKKCTDPFTHDPECTCQPIEQSGNTSGPHVHVTLSRSGGNLLACLKGN